MVRPILVVMALSATVCLVRPSAQEAAATPAAGPVIATVKIPQDVFAGGMRLPAGTYDIRLTNESLDALPGQTAGAERRIEFVSHGTVVARDAAVVEMPDSNVVGTSSAPAANGNARVEMLKGGDFLRVSVTHDGMRYRIHLPVD